MNLGLSPEPGGNSSLASRLVCAKCFVTPQIVKVDGTDVLTITVKCHGMHETKTVSKSSLVFTLHFFEENDQVEE